MAKGKGVTAAATVMALRPYIERAMADPEFREKVQKGVSEAYAAAQTAMGDVSKKDGVRKSANNLLSDKQAQKHLRKALEELGAAGEKLKPGKKSHKVRNTMLLSGMIAGALYNPWTGEQTRTWITGKIAGDDELRPLETFETLGSTSEEAVREGAEAVSAAVESAGDQPGNGKG